MTPLPQMMAVVDTVERLRHRKGPASATALEADVRALYRAQGLPLDEGHLQQALTPAAPKEIPSKPASSGSDSTPSNPLGLLATVGALIVSGYLWLTPSPNDQATLARNLVPTIQATMQPAHWDAQAAPSAMAHLTRALQPLGQVSVININGLASVTITGLSVSDCQAFSGTLYEDARQYAQTSVTLNGRLLTTRDQVLRSNGQCEVIPRSTVTVTLPDELRPWQAHAP